jgi:hypothetical protein
MNAVIAADTNAVVASSVELSPTVGVGAVAVKAGLARGAFVFSAALTLAEKIGSLPTADASLLRVFRFDGAPPIRAVIND